ncbi:MAG: extracellular solute-binding protein [Elusimicrobia bacterium]|nr:extracellular solute-binding protein [Elusimicrobiota bacterium]
MKKYRALFLLLAASLAGVACLRPPGQKNDANTLVVWEQEDALVAPFLDSILNEFKKQPGNENLSIQRVHYHTEDLRQQFQTASIAGSPPDIIIGPPDMAGVFAVSGFILPLDGLFDFSQYSKQALGPVTMDGKIWGVPTSVGNHLMLLYNKKLAPQAPQSTEELFKVCPGLVRGKNLSYCLAYDMNEPYWLIPWLTAFGGWPLDGNNPTLDTPAMLAAVKFYLELRYDRKLVPMECDYNCMDSLFKEEKVAFIINGDWALADYRSRMGDNLGAARIPKMSSTGRWPSPMVGGKDMMFSSKLSGAKLETAKKLAVFFTSDENQLRQARELYRIPSVSRLAAAPELQRDALLKGSIEQMQVASPMPMLTELRAIWDSGRHYLGGITQKKMTPEDGLRRMQKDCEGKIQEMMR